MYLWDVATGDVVRRFSGHGDWVLSVAFSPDKAQIVSGSLDGTIRFWDVGTGEQIMLLDHGYEVYSLALSHDGRFLSSAGLEVLRLWDIPNVGLQTTPEEMGNPLNFVHFPNPVGGVVTVEYSLSNPGQVQLLVYDLLGREMALVVDAVQSKGDHRLQLSTKAFSRGMYFLKFMTDDRQVTKPLIIR